jgi:hypothetical protein
LNHDPSDAQAGPGGRGDTASHDPDNFRRTLDKPQAFVTLDSAGRVWAELNGRRRGLFQVVAGIACYQFPNGKLDATIGAAEVKDNQIILTLSL